MAIYDPKDDDLQEREFGPFEYKGRHYAYKSQVDRERLNDAAPELLEALKAIRQELRNHNVLNELRVIELWQIANAAIAKAEGED